MSADGFDYAPLVRKTAPPPAPRFTGFPKYNFIGGHNDPTEIPVEALAKAADTVLRREGAKLAMYNMAQGPLGYEGLRDFVVKKVARRGITCTRDEVLITSGSGPGIDLVNQVLLDPGDTVIAEEFTYGGALTKLKKFGATIIGAPLDKGGIQIEALAAILDELKRKGTRAKYIYTIPSIQNPTGSIMSLERRRQLLEVAARYGVPIFEDECYTDLNFTDHMPPAIYSLDPGRVIHIGSFSKSLAPALRVGYVVAPWPILSRMVACKTDGGTGAIEQMVIAEYFGGEFEPHVRQLSGVLKAKLATMVDAVEKEFGTAAECWAPDGGIFLWLKLPDAVDVTKLVKPAADAGIAFNPGPEWACDPARAKSHLRLCFALPSHDEIRAGVAAFARVCFEQTGIPAQSANVRHRV
ncbi:MAG TPA: PLP-dependent aminotransferase family protein [Candidatus Sulfotelmatobacter sp.]|nr:PLP-dependent aminotransferase family protein [Candidatus Sulfotelmatobacter sp.]